MSKQYIHLKVPIEWNDIYYTLLTQIASIGKDMIDDCTAMCQGNVKHIVSCWNLFQAALACKELGRDKEADLFIKYIEKQFILLDSPLQPDVDLDPFIDKDGQIKVNTLSTEQTHFTVNVESGELIQSVDENSEFEYSIQDNNLTIKEKENERV